MNREDIIKLAREAGFDLEMWQLSLGSNVWGTHEELERFAALVAAAERNRTWTQDHWTEYERSIAAAAKAEEREACAKVCESMRGECWAYDHDRIAAAIRARSNT